MPPANPGLVLVIASLQTAVVAAQKNIYKEYLHKYKEYRVVSKAILQ